MDRGNNKNNKTMTDFDKKLIQKANNLPRWNYRDIDVLISIADTAQAKERLLDIRMELRDLTRETL